MPAFLTASGLQKLAVATPEQPMTVKYMAIGTGTGTPTENIGALFNEVYRIEIPNPLRDPSNPRNLEFTGHIPTTVGGWTITELGLYDSNGVLVAYDLLSESIVKSPPDSALKTDMYPTIVVALSNTEETTLIVSSSIEFDHAALTGRSKDNSHPMSAISGLQGALDQKTTDLNNHIAYSASRDQSNVKISGGQKIAGIKQFHSPIVSDGANITDIPLGNVTGLSKFKDDFDSSKVTKIVTADYTMLPTDGGILEVDASEGSIVITVAKSSTHATKRFIILRTDSTANTVRINPSAGDTFNGEGLSYPYGWAHQYETIIFIAGRHYWTGVRSPKTSVSFDSATGVASLIHKGVVSGHIMTANESLGWGQTWQNMTSQRNEYNKNYTNNTGRPITVAISMKDTGAVSSTNLVVGGVTVAQIDDLSGGESSHAFVSAIVPNGAVYSINFGTSSSGNHITNWAELR